MATRPTDLSSPSSGLGDPLLAVLLACYIRQLRNLAWSHASRPRALVLAVVAVVGLIVNWSISSALFSTLALSAGQVASASQVIVLMVMGFGLISSLSFGASALYMARDLDQIMVAPVSPHSILLSRLVAQYAYGMGTGLYLVGPTAVAFCVSRGTALAFVPLFLGLSGIVAVVLAVATCMVVLGARIVPAGIVQSAVGVGVAGAVFIAASVRVTHAGGLGTVAGPIARASHLESIAPPAQWQGPAVWTWAAGWLAAGALAVAIGVGALAGVYGRGYRDQRVWWHGVSWPRRRRAMPRARGAIPALAVKDALSLLRDIGQLGQYLLPVLLFILYAAAAEAPIPATRLLPVWFFAAITAQFGGLFAASGFALRAISLEGGRIWQIQSAPVAPWRLVVAKVLVGSSFAVPVAILTFALGALRSSVSLSVTLPVYPGEFFLTIAVVAGAVAMGSVRPRLGWSDPRRAGSFLLTLAFLLAGAIFIAAAYVLLALGFTLHLPVPLLSAISSVVAILISLAAVYFAAQRLSRLSD